MYYNFCVWVSAYTYSELKKPKPNQNIVMADKKQVIIPTGSMIFVIGPPCSGKGTFCSRLSEMIKLLHVQTGDILRKSTDPDIIDIMSKGGLIEDDRIVSETVNHIRMHYRPGEHRLLIVDGLPRTSKQVDMIPQIAKGAHIHRSQVFALQLTVGDRLAEKRFLASLENDENRKYRPDNDLGVFKKRLQGYRWNQPQVLEALHQTRIPVVKRETNNSTLAAEQFHTKHILKSSYHQGGGHKSHGQCVHHQRTEF